ncbi:MAG: hypothetical protein NVS9B15_24570 [Acidobacteriaceae bacterium]
MPRGGTSAVITTRAVLRFAADGEAFLASHHPLCSVEEIQANTGRALKIADDVKPTPAPTERELAAIREYDTEGFWTS